MEAQGIKEGNVRSTKALSAEEWEVHKDAIQDLYITRDFPLARVIEEMKKLDFVTTKRMYKSKFKDWKMAKNAKRQDLLAFAKIYQERRSTGITEPLVSIHNKVRGIQYLRKYLKDHDEPDEAVFFAEATATQVPTLDHVWACGPDGSALPDVNMEDFSWFDDPAAFAELSDLSTWQMMHGAGISDFRHNTYGDELQPRNPMYEPPSTSATVQEAPAGPAQLEMLSPTYQNTDSWYISTCQFACMFGAARKYDLMSLRLQEASFFFKQLCLSQSSEILTAASWMLTWLLLHAEGSLSESVMRNSLRAATEVLGSDDPVCVLLEWLTAAAANSLNACHVHSARLQLIWQGFQTTLGDDHGHTIVALYCLSFHLILVDREYLQAEQYLQTLCQISVMALGSSHTLTINILATLSRSQLRQGKYAAALETIARALASAPLGINHPHRLELLLRQAIVYRKLGNTIKAEELYWIVVKGRVATLGRHHKTSVAAHDSLVDVLKENGTWEARKDEIHNLLIDPQVSVDDYEAWWRQNLEVVSGGERQGQVSSDEAE